MMKFYKPEGPVPGKGQELRTNIQRLFIRTVSILTLVVLYIGIYALPATAQDREITGTVTDEHNETLIGVSVKVKNSQRGTVTDLLGKYRITASTGDSLQFSYLGYLVSTRVVGASSVINISLSPDDKRLSEVVVTGYSTQTRSQLTGSIAQISADKLTDATSPSVASLIQGKVPGVSVVSSSGRPGSGAQIRVRGRSSINSGIEPLWVVDGVIMHGVPNLNPADIENISILKDASSASLYGSRGANGVIVVTTRVPKGSKGEINASIKTGISTFNTGEFALMNANQLVEYYGMFANQSAVPGWFSPNLASTNTNWLRIGSQDAPTTEVDLSYSGSTDRTKVYIAGNSFREEGTVKGYQYNRYSARANLDYKISEKLSIQPKISGTYTSGSDQQHSVYEMYRNLPWDAPYSASGEIVNPRVNGTTWYGRDLSNYLYNLQWNKSASNIANLLVNGDFLYKISNEFSFKSTNNVTYYHSDASSYVDPKATNGVADQGRLSNSMAKRITRFTNQLLRFNKAFDRHTVNALVSYEYSDYKYNDVSATGKGIVPGITIIGATSEPTTISGTANDYAFQSALFNATYDYSDRYAAQFSFRRDGSSRFGNESQYGNFFSVGAAWNIHNESFFKARQVHYLRLKAAYGGVGNTPNSLYPQYELYSLSAQYNGLPTAFPSSLGNSTLTWEKTYDTNLGVELGLFDRLDLAVEVYNKNTSNLLHFVPLPAISGYSGFYDNIGAVQNRGIEASLGARILSSPKGFNWRLDFNIGKNVNKVKELYQGKDQVSGNQIYKQGEDINTFYMRKWVGVDPATGNPQWEAVNQTSGEVTTTGNYTAASLQMVGKGTPDFFGGFNSNMSYKGVRLESTFAFSSGGLVYHGQRETFDSDGAYPTYNQVVLKSGWSRWTPENPNATHPRAYFGGNNRSNGPSSRYLEDQSFFRMRNVTLSYTLPQAIVSRLKAKGISAYFSGDNLMTLTQFSGLDPETIDYPLPKRFMFGLNLTL
ncbi:MAG TPA: SusC/RagA family TonB-linked outer membrane protein [Daejeonella sp.]